MQEKLEWRLFVWFAISTAIIGLILVSFRIFLAADFTDESYYIALPYAFSLGLRPYIDEYSLVQNPGVLLQPLVSFYIWLMGSNEGIVLFFRCLSLVLSGLIGFLIFITTKSDLGRLNAFLLACLFVVFMPFAIAGVSYNTLSMQAILAGTIFYFKAYTGDNKLAKLSVGHALILFASFCYISLVVLAVVFHAWIFFIFSRSNKCSVKSILFSFILPWIFFFFAVLYALRYSSISNLREILAYYQGIQVQGPGKYKLFLIYNQIKELIPSVLILFSALTIAYQSAKRRLVFVVPLIIWLALYLFELVLKTNIAFHMSLFLLPLIGAFALVSPMRPKVSGREGVLAIFILPGIVSGLFFSLNSGNGLTNGVLGVWPTILGVGYILCEFKVGSRLLSAVLVGIIPFQVLALYKSVYGNLDPIHSNTVKVKMGPFAGLTISPVKADFLERLSEALKHAPDGTILFLEGFPAGYLMSNRRPETVNLWALPRNILPTDRKLLLSPFITGKKPWPTVVVIIHKFPLGQREKLDFDQGDLDDYKREFSGSKYSLLYREEDFEIRIRKM